MSNEVEDAVISLLSALSRIGLIDLSKISIVLSGLGEELFICHPGSRMNYNSIAVELDKHPILIECDSKRLYAIRKGVGKLLKRTVKYKIVGRRSRPVYLLWLDGQEDMLPPCIVDGGDCGGESRGPS